MSRGDHIDTQEFRDLMRTRDVPMNRKQRRQIAKKAGVRFSAVNPGMARNDPTYLGIRRFKKAVGSEKTEALDPVELKDQYKSNAWSSKRELEHRRAIEAAQAAGVDMQPVELTDEQMKELTGGADT